MDVRKEVITMTNKMTKIEVFEAAIRLISAATIEDRGEDAAHCDEVLQGLQHEIDLLNDKRTKAKEGTTESAKKKIEEQRVIMESMFDVLTDGKRHTATELGKAAGVSVQKASALLKKMVENGECQKVIEKKVSYFFLDDDDNAVDAEDQPKAD